MSGTQSDVNARVLHAVTGFLQEIDYLKLVNSKKDINLDVFKHAVATLAHLGGGVSLAIPPPSAPAAQAPETNAINLDEEFLALKNSHARDVELEFDEAEHKYTIKCLGDSPGKQAGVKSVTAFSSDDFNPNMAISAIFRSKRHKNDPSYEYYQMTKEQILKKWEYSQELGTELHKDIEIFLNRRAKLEDDFINRKMSTRLQLTRATSNADGDIVDSLTAAFEKQLNLGGSANGPSGSGSGRPSSGGASASGDGSGSPDRRSVLEAVQNTDDEHKIERSYFMGFLKDVIETRNWTPHRTEWRLWDAELQVAGTIDLACIERGLPDGDDDPYADREKVILVDWKRTKKVKRAAYEKQLNLYRHILEFNYGVLVTEMYIVRFHPNSDSYELVDIPRVQSHVKEALENGGKVLSEKRLRFLASDYPPLDTVDGEAAAGEANSPGREAEESNSNAGGFGAGLMSLLRPSVG